MTTMIDRRHWVVARTIKASPGITAREGGDQFGFASSRVTLITQIGGMRKSFRFFLSGTLEPERARRLGRMVYR